MPDWKTETKARLADLNVEPAREAGIVEEISQHLEDRFLELRARGASEEEARRGALEELSGEDFLARELKRVERSPGVEPAVFGQTKGNIMEDLFADLKYGARMLRKNPGFTAVAVLTVALGVGANIAIFAVVDSVLLRPLPFPEPDRLVTMFNTYPKAGVERDGSSVANYYERRGNIPAFSHLSRFRYDTAIVGEAGSTEQEEVLRVSPEFFSTLGVGPSLGRSFSEEETTYQTDNEAVLTDACWRQRFNADPSLLGRTVRVDGISKTIVGVLPPSFRFLSSKARIYFPLSSNPEQRGAMARHSGSGSDIVARLMPGATLAEAQSQIDAHNAAHAAEYPNAKMIADAGFRTIVTPLHADHVKTIRPVLLLMQTGVFLLLLIGGVNLVNLLLIRASSRTRELAIRRCLGASRRRVVSQVLSETVLLTAIGGLFGLAVGAEGIHVLAVLGARQLPLGARMAFDLPLALEAMLGAVVIGGIIAGPIAYFNLSDHPALALRTETRDGTASHATQGLRHALVVAQIAFAFVLLAGAGLLGLSLKRAMAISPGFRADHVLTGKISLPGKNYPDWPARLAFIERLLQGVKEQPGVAAAGIINNVPFSGDNQESGFVVQGHVRQPGESLRGYYFYGVGGDLFAALGIPLREGRFLGEADSGRRVCVVDEDFARLNWPKGGAVGHRLFVGASEGPDGEAFTIVGVVGAMKQAEITETQAQGAVYAPYQFRTAVNMFAVVRTTQQPESFGLSLRHIVRTVDPELPVDDLRSMEVRIADSLLGRRAPALLAGIFASVALLLAAIGTYGVLSYAVAQRRHEIGVRMALGAQRQQIAHHFLLLGLRLLAIGTLLGALGALLAAQAMQKILFNVPALQPATFLGTALVMAAVSMAACWLPARRAMCVDPMTVMRYE
ncbi:MAG: ADOP family duplicated permease [Limisphaerales bacterium]